MDGIMNGNTSIDNAASPESSRPEAAIPARTFWQKTPVVVTLCEHPPGSESASAREFSATTAPSAPAKKDWNSLLSRNRQQTQGVAPAGAQPEVGPIGVRLAQVRPVEIREDLLNAVVAATAAQRAESSLTEVPAGFHDGFVLSRLLKSRKPVSGLVVSIGVHTGGLGGNGPASSQPDAIRVLIQTLVGPRDFACQVRAEEFLLIYPNENGASAQRRLSYISQRLWDFQLRSLGEASVLFSWGGVEVHSESIDEAVASASERMRETRRSRKDFAMDRSLRQAV